MRVLAGVVLAVALIWMHRRKQTRWTEKLNGWAQRREPNSYQLLDTDSGNYIGGYATQAEALDVALVAFRTSWPQATDGRLALTHTDKYGNILYVLDGPALQQRLGPSDISDALNRA